MTATAEQIESLTLKVSQEIQVHAPLEATFEAVLEQMGAGFETPDGKSMSMKIEAWPGGRWYRDLGDGNGHFWGHVQAIKRPTLMEICGPLFSSSPLLSNVQYRLTAKEGGTVIHFRHSAIGVMSEEHKKGVVHGWGSLLDRIRRHAEKRAD